MDLFTGARRWIRGMASGPERGEWVLDVFAGGGGTSKGIEGSGIKVEVAINHDAHAVEIHKLNHPGTRHFCCGVREVDPRTVLPERPIGLMWLSPDCTHHSRAKGGKPLKRNSRALANVVFPWIVGRGEMRPRVIILENVAEFEGWGPLGKDGQPLKNRKGESFKAWVRKLRRLGYDVEWRTLVAADYGAPTIRKRLFLIARCDGQRIVWPDKTHAPAKLATMLGLQPWRAAYECIDFSIPTQSIFERRKDLAFNTLRRVHSGIMKFVFGGDPFIVSTNHSGEGFRGQSVDEPMTTVTASRDFGAVVTPTLISIDHASSKSGEADPKQPLRTITRENRHALVEQFMIRFKNGEGAKDPRDPMNAITSKAADGVAEAFLLGAGGPERAGRPRSTKKPMGTILKKNSTALAAAFLSPYHKLKGPKETRGHDLGAPAPTVDTQNRHAFVAATLQTFRGTSKAGRDMRAPMPAITAGGLHVAEVRAFLVKYFGTGAAVSVKSPAPTLTAKHRLGLVEVRGFLYQIVDICLRMLTPMELLRAQCGKYAEGYVLTGNQEQQVKAIGNMVPPEVAEALVRANVPRLLDSRAALRLH